MTWMSPGNVREAIAAAPPTRSDVSGLAARRPAEVVEDRFRRPLRDLRLSVTDRCNFRCTYCMPKEVFGRDYAFLPRHEILTFEESARLVAAFVALGVEKVRITGGEPLLRRDLPELIARLSRIDGLRDLTLTTNGAALVAHATALRSAGLHRLTVSLDALDERAFRALNDVDFPVAHVLDGIATALAAGFKPIKINMMVKRGVNDSELLPMARQFSGPDFILRFIEYMDVGNTNGWRLDQVVPADEIIDRLGGEFALEAIPANYPGEVAHRFRTREGGEIGIIASVTQPFCQSCTRARISADGRFYTCLFASEGRDLRTLLRDGRDDATLRDTIRNIWRGRADNYSEIRSAATVGRSKAEMSLLGG